MKRLKKDNPPRLKSGGNKIRFLLPICAGLAVTALLVMVAFARFTVLGYMPEDGYAVPQQALDTLLSTGDGTEQLPLTQVHMGDAIYVRAVGSKDYFIGDNKDPISSSYPVYVRDGQLLCFLNGDLKLVTAEWETLDSYQDLYLTDGVTFNADSSQADFEEVLLAQVGSGYIAGQEITVSSGALSNTIPMNAVCAFGTSRILFYAYADGRLEGGMVRMAASSMIRVGEHAFTYREFLEKLGLWETKNQDSENKTKPVIPDKGEQNSESTDEEVGKEPEAVIGSEQEDDTAQAEKPTRQRPATPGTEVVFPQNDETYEEEAGAPEIHRRTEKSGDRHESSKKPSDKFQQPSEAIANPDEAPASAAPPSEALKQNAEYKEPEVSFSGLSSWVYTIDLSATVIDESRVIDGGVKIVVRKVEKVKKTQKNPETQQEEEVEIEQETVVLRRTIAASGDFALGQVEPDTLFHVTAEYEYEDRLGYMQKLSFDLGTIRTLPFDTLGEVKITMRDYRDPTTAPGSEVKFFSSCVQLRDVYFNNVRSGQPAVEVGGTKNVTGGDPHRAETYINRLDMSFSFEDTDRKANDLSMDAAALTLLRSGYTLSHWETEKSLRSGSNYKFTVSASDRFGNVFKTSFNKECYFGHTCKLEPTAKIAVPAAQNFAGNVQFDVTVANKDGAPITPNPGVEVVPTTKQYLGPDGLTALYLVKKGDAVAPENAIPLTGYLTADPTQTVKDQKFLPVGAPNEAGKTLMTRWTITNLELFKDYTAAVLCGQYDIEDGQLHVDTTLESTTSFVTASLANLGTIPYTNAGAENLTYQTADVRFRIENNENDHYFKPLVLELVREIDVTLSNSKTDKKVGSLRWTRAELEKVAIPTGEPVGTLGELKYFEVQVPVYLDDETVVRLMPMRLYWENTLPMIGEEQVRNVWEFLKATSMTKDSCWVGFTFGGGVSLPQAPTEPGAEVPSARSLIELTPQTGYTADIQTWAGQEGTKLENVSSKVTKKLQFTTRSRDAEISFSDAFVSSDFIELYDVEFFDSDSCIMPDSADRGGNNVQIVIYDQVGNRVSAQYLTTEQDTGAEDNKAYINSTKKYSKLHISGLKENTDYVLRFLAQKYANGGLVEMSYPVVFELLAANGAPDVRSYYFSTGESVTGSIDLLNVSQSYVLGDGTVSTELSMLSSDDYYLNTFRQYYYNYYGVLANEGSGWQRYIPVTDSSGNAVDENDDGVPDTKLNPEESPARLKYKDEMYHEYTEEEQAAGLVGAYSYEDAAGKTHNFDTKESDLAKYDPAALEWLTHATETYSTTNTATDANYRSYIAITQMSDSMLTYEGDYWATRYIRVKPGEEYVIYNCANINDPRINFYYINSYGCLQYYTYWGSSYQFNGEVFRVPENLTSSSPADHKEYGYMCISGRTTGGVQGTIVEKYDEARLGPDLLHDENNELKYMIQPGVYLSTSDGLSANPNMGYTSEYIPAESGSVYQFTGMDTVRTNIEGAKTYSTNTMSTETVLFYDKSYTFIGSYTVGAQCALVKAPFNTAYCRFNVNYGVDENSEKYFNDSALSMRLYTQAQNGRFLAELGLTLEDRSDPPLMVDGSTYTVTIYQTPGTVPESEILEDFRNWEQLWTETVVFPESLSVDEVIRMEGLDANRGFKAVLTIQPTGWKNSIELDSVYFMTYRVTHVITDLAGLMNIRNDPAGSYVVAADIAEPVTARVLGSDRPFSGTIDFRGHTINMQYHVGLFYKLTRSAILQNLNFEHDYAYPSSTSYLSEPGLVVYNYGTMRNVIVHYATTCPYWTWADNYASGAICSYNYGMIDGFVVEFLEDIDVNYYFGGVCYENHGTIQNGYVCSKQVGAQNVAHLVHYPVWQGKTAGSNSVSRVGYICGYNTPSGAVRNVFAINDLFIGSSNKDAHESGTYDGDTTIKDSSTTSFNTAALLIGQNEGVFENGFTVGDRYDFEGEDYNILECRRVATNRGPAITYAAGQYSVENLTYFSPAYAIYDVKKNAYDSNAQIGEYNRHGEMRTLYDWRWYEGVLGADGSRFSIRDPLENRATACYPRLVLPSGFDDTDQPYVELPIRTESQIELSNNVVRVAGPRSALVTVTLYNPYEIELTGITVVDRNGIELNSEILEQQTVGDDYRVELLITLDGTDAVGDSSYILNGWRSGTSGDSFSLASDARVVQVDFWDSIASIDDWKTMIGRASPILGNYWLTQDLDFSESTSYADWYCGKYFLGKLNGGIYDTEEVVLTDSLGNVLYADEEQTEPRTLEVWGELTGRRIIGGVHTLDEKGEPTAALGKNASYSSSLFLYMYGTAQNLIFERFVTGPGSTGASNSAINSSYGGVFCISQYGTKIDNCHVRDCTFYATTYLGGLLGYANGASVTNCSVADTVKINTWRVNDATSTVYCGGVVGYLSGSLVRNCWSAARINAPDVYASAGVGGVVGYASSSIVTDDYFCGSIDAYCIYVGGIAGQLTGADSLLEHCWSSGTAQTVSDYCGGVVGYHPSGTMRYNFTSTTVLTRSLAASFVHRICNNVSFDQNYRYNNYAFSDQYLSYFDAGAGEKSSPYKFGTWTEPDGATGLLTETELRARGVWENILEFDGAYDCGTAENGVYPKLINSTTGRMMEFQPDIAISRASEARLVVLSSGLNPQTAMLEANVGIIHEAWSDDDFEQAAWDELIDWSSLSAIGAKIMVSDSDKQRGVDWTGGPNGEAVRIFRITLDYTDDAVGHYLDSYIVSMNVYRTRGSTVTESLQTKIGLSGSTAETQAVYREIRSAADWDLFFKNTEHAAAYENIKLRSPEEGGNYDFTPEDIFRVRVNRLVCHDPGGAIITGGINVTKAGDGLVGVCITQMSNITFRDFSLTVGTTSKISTVGVVGSCQGLCTNCTIENLTIDAQNATRVGFIGNLTGTMEDITAKGIQLIADDTRVGDRYGLLVGEGTVTSTIQRIRLSASTGDNGRNMLRAVHGSYEGGIVGLMYGRIYDCCVTDTTVYGRYCAGGLVGDLESSAACVAGQNRYQNLTVGTEVDENWKPIIPENDTTEPGVLRDADGGLKPNVTVSTEYYRVNYDCTSQITYIGGIFGYCYANTATCAGRDVYAYNVMVKVPTKSATDTSSNVDDETYNNYQVGGVAGRGATYMTYATAENCTVYSYGSAVGGVSGLYIGNYATAKECVVYGVGPYTGRIGGVVGYDGLYRALAQHCVVAGPRQVGGLIGLASSNVYNSVTTDCVVVANERAGGVAGEQTTHNVYINIINASNDPQGQATISTKLTEKMFPDMPTDTEMWDMATAGTDGTTVTGALIRGRQEVGGAMGRCCGVNLNYQTIGSNVNIVGTENVGGIAGTFYGWWFANYPTYERYMYQDLVAANIYGQENVGGLIGYFTRDTDLHTESTSTGALIRSGSGKTPNYFYGNLLIGNVFDTDPDGSRDYSTTGALIGGFDPICDETLDALYENNKLYNAAGTLLQGNGLPKPEPGIDNFNGTMMGNCVVWEGSTVDGTNLSALPKWSKVNTTYDFAADGITKTWMYSSTNAVEGEDFRKLLTVTAEDLAEEDIYFIGRGSATTTYNSGLGWSRSYREDDSLSSMYSYAVTGGPVIGAAGGTVGNSIGISATVDQLRNGDLKAPDFETYEDGVYEDGLVLWLDGRNNTGLGYTDVNSYVWKDLSPSRNDATLYFAKKSPSNNENLTYAERRTVMRWIDGGLDWISSTSEYYAELKDSIDRYLNDGKYTVELVYVNTQPRQVDQHKGILSWFNGVSRGGFHGDYRSNGTTITGNISSANYYKQPWYYRSTILFYAPGVNEQPGKSFPYGWPADDPSRTNELSMDVERTVSFVADAREAYDYNATTKRYGILRYYLNGALTAQRLGDVIESNIDNARIPGSPGYPFVEDAFWRVGYGYYGNASIRVLGVRVYDGALTEEQIKKHEAYDRWYYFGDAAPTDAAEPAGKGQIDWASHEPCRLMRSDVYGYNGQLISENYTGDGSDLNRGYWYLTDGSGKYSTIKVNLDAVNYAPHVRVEAISGEVFGGGVYEYLRGQEGEDAEGNLYDCQDAFYQGGVVLPKAGVQIYDTTVIRPYAERPAAEPVMMMMAAPKSTMSPPKVRIPEFTVYASGVGTVNLELLSDAPTGLCYEVTVNGGKTSALSGVWPSDSRTVTMTWDYETPFTLTLTLGSQTESADYTYAGLAHTVMAWGDSYWYLYGSECVAADGRTVNDGAQAFVHMMDGLLLDEDGGVWDAATGEYRTALGTPFRKTTTAPLWSGTIALDSTKVAVRSFGTYLVSDGGVKDTQLVVKGGAAYTMPHSDVCVGSFVADSYGGSVYNTVLGRDGMLADLGTALVYPEDFTNAKIRETSNTMNYSGHVLLVRYQTGMIVAFDYLTGERVTVRSQKESEPSLMSFLSQSLGLSLGAKRSVLSGGAQQALRAVDYQAQVDGDASLRTALTNLKSNEENLVAVDGEGGGVYSDELHGALNDGTVNDGLNADTGVGVTDGEAGPLLPDDGTVREGVEALPGGTAVAGDVVVAGDIPSVLPNPSEDLTAQEPIPPEAAAPVPEAVSDGPADEASEELPEGGAARLDGDAAEPAEEVPAEEQPTEDALPEVGTTEADGSADAQPEQKSGGRANGGTVGDGAAADEGVQSYEIVTLRHVEEPLTVSTRYVQVFTPEDASSAVYDLEELLTVPEEKLIPQERRAEQLEEMGFTTALVTRKVIVEEHAGGLLLMTAMAAATLTLLVALAFIKRRKL